MKNKVIFDLEIFHNYFLAAFKDMKTGAVKTFEMFDGQPLDVTAIHGIIARNELISFNAIKFDMPMLALAMCKRVNNSNLKDACDKLILDAAPPWQVLASWGVRPLVADVIDIIDVAPGMASLKIYGGRMHCPKLQDLPFSPSSRIFDDDRETVRMYCVNDLDTTEALFYKLQPQIDLRRKMSIQYDTDLRSKSDAQIAESVIKSEIAKITGEAVPRPVVQRNKAIKYKRPDFIRFETAQLQDLASKIDSLKFMTDPDGRPDMPAELQDVKIVIGGSTYSLGIGGLHSNERKTAHFSDDNYVLIDRDVASYYPSIILNQSLFPVHLTRAFCDVYRSIVERRLKAKRTKDTVTSDSLKIVLNGSFGKFGSPFSILYAPDLLIQTTLTGQLALLMLIEVIEAQGIAIVSANTDGIVIKCPRAKLDTLNSVIREWEFFTGFDTEETRYDAIYSSNVNNYIAVKKDGTTKSKGWYGSTGLAKSPKGEICNDAVLQYLTKQTPVETTIRDCQDITKFITVRAVTGGATWQGSDLGKAVRFYYAEGLQGAIHYKKNNNKVPLSEGAQPVMDLPDEMPENIDYQLYNKKAREILADIGAIS